MNSLIVALIWSFILTVTLILISINYALNNIQEEIKKLKKRVDQLEEEKCNGKCNCIQHS